MKWIVSLIVIILTNGCSASKMNGNIASSVVKKPEKFEFVIQELSPTEGSIKKPKDWFYRESHLAAYSLGWVISKENPKNGYDTGVRVQLMMGINKYTGNTPEKFVDDQISQLSRKGKITNFCGKHKAGDFNRKCIEIIDNKYHVLYSILWSNQRDMVGVVTMGTPKELWYIYSPAFKQMSEVTVIGKDFYKKIEKSK